MGDIFLHTFRERTTFLSSIWLSANANGILFIILFGGRGWGGVVVPGRISKGLKGSYELKESGFFC